jgi:hypothetical protein
MKYKKGDKVKLITGNIKEDLRGMVVTIDGTEGLGYYKTLELPGLIPYQMIEGLVEEEIPLNIDDFQDDDEIIDIIDEYVHRLKDNECQIDLPEGYQFTDENGNVISATKIVLEKKKKEYPKTYEECCKVLGIDTLGHSSDGYKWEILSIFQNLLICRDAYWKIAGEEMELGKPWKPNWELGNQKKYCIYNDMNIIKTGICYFGNDILAFPTEKIRDNFYENFRKLIEQCEELL